MLYILAIRTKVRGTSHQTPTLIDCRLLKNSALEGLAADPLDPATNRCVCQQQRRAIMRYFVQLVNPSVYLLSTALRRFALSHRFVFTSALRQGQNYSQPWAALQAPLRPSYKSPGPGRTLSMPTTAYASGNARRAAAVSIRRQHPPGASSCRRQWPCAGYPATRKMQSK